jgi:hypothetical protein
MPVAQHANHVGVAGDKEFVRIEFGECVTEGMLVHSAVLMTDSTAESLIELLQSVLNKKQADRKGGVTIMPPKH